MFNALSHSFLYVKDHDEAIDFYVGKLGFEVSADAQLEQFRWLTLIVPGRPEHEIVVMVPGSPAHDPETAATIFDAMSKGAFGMGILATDDCRGVFETLRDRGVEFTEEPTERFYGIDCALRDPFGNYLRITQHATRPIEMPQR